MKIPKLNWKTLINLSFLFQDMYQAYIDWELSLYIIFVATVILVTVFGLKRIFNREKRR